SFASHLPIIKKAIDIDLKPANPNISDAIRKLVQAPIYGMNMYKALSRAKIGFNIHADIASNFAANMRMFEVTGVGSCLITDWKPNLHEMFEDGEEVVSYKTAEECVEKVKYLLDHPEERKRIAQNGQQRVFRQHTYTNRIAKLHEFILKELSLK
ncbi:MAG: glycosyltransferase, partial [Bacteroidota bacterium]